MPRSSTFCFAFIAAAPLLVRADCIDDAAARHRVNALVLRAIGWHESRLQPLAVGHNQDGSSDVGAFQINGVHLQELARFGIGARALVDGCVSADVAAWHYRRQVDAFGNTWTAVGAYHSRTPTRLAGYANQIAIVLMGWRAMPTGPLPFGRASTATSPQPPGRPARTREAMEVSRTDANAGAAPARASGASPSRPSPRSVATPSRQTTGDGVADPAAFSNLTVDTLAFRPSTR